MVLPYGGTARVWRIVLRSSFIGRLTANLCLDTIKRADTIERASGRRRRMRSVDVVKLAAGLSPAGRFASSRVGYVYIHRQKTKRSWVPAPLRFDVILGFPSASVFLRP
jgi:hypothetical protein